MRMGKPPTKTHNAELRASTVINRQTWEIWQYWHKDKPAHPTHEYLKVICRGRKLKANYWLGWDAERETWLYQACDYKLLREREPEVAAWCETVLLGLLD